MNNVKLLLIALAEALTTAADSIPGEATTVTPKPEAQVTPQQVADAELDSDGLPWDERIHASTKSKTAAGAWTKRRGVDDATRDAVIAELREAYPAPAQEAPAPAPAPAAPAAPAAPQVPSISVPTPAPAAPKSKYEELVDWIARNSGEGKALTDDYIKQVFESNNTELAALAGNDDACVQWLEALRGVLKQMGVAEA